MEKICTKCKVIREIDLFHIKKESKDGYCPHCKECEKIQKLKYYLNNKDKFNIYKEKNKNIIKENRKNWYLKNKEKVKEYNQINNDIFKIYRKEYNIKNKEKSKKYQKENKNHFNEYRQNRYDTDPKYKLKLLLRGRLYEMLKKQKSPKNESALKLVGCSINEFKKYIESLWKVEMTWENHGKIWELDHIKPCDSFNLLLREEQQECFHYTNFQPLFKTTSIAESFGYKNEIGNRNKSNEIWK